jgi:hypothetical protein
VELATRAGLAPAALDAARLAALADGLPPGASPWPLVPLAIVSLDLIKQPDILHGLMQGAWDLCVIDEAHLLTPGTARAQAARVVADRSLRVLLLTATPHDGNDEHYAALCTLGRLWDDEPLALFARPRGTDALAAPTPSPRVLRLGIHPSPKERHLHQLLARYVARVWTSASRDRSPARLAMTVLAKRAASGPWALARSLERRLEMLDAAAAGAASQPSLFTAPDDVEQEDDVPDAMLAAPGLPPAQERLWLRLLVNAARAATPHDRKLAALRRLLRRTPEPAIVFTEYRDTLRHCADVLRPERRLTVLHGGLPAEVRHEAAAAFLDGRATLLLATDAASLGLNLHARCRLVVHLELPWNPLRLEQRTGRVDRIGQTRRVHAIELVSRSSWEARIATRLDERRARIDAARRAGAPPAEDADPAVLLAEALDLPSAARSSVGRRGSSGVLRPSLGAEARALASRLAVRRGWLSAGTRRPDRPTMCRLNGRARQRLGLSRGVVAVHLTRDADASGERERRLSITDWHGEPPPRPLHRHEAAWSPLLEALRRAALTSEPPAAAAEVAGDALVTRRARIIARRRAAARRAEQLALFPDRASMDAPAPPAAFDAATMGVGSGTAALRSAELVALLILE